MVIIPKFVFLFRSIILSLPRKDLNRVQCMFDNFIWAGRKARIRADFMQQRKDQVGVSLPSVELYYQAGSLEHILQWWGIPNKGIWELEQIDLNVP